MSKAKLKKVLASMSGEEIAEMVVELYERRKEARDYIEYWLDPDSEKELERCKSASRKLFFSSGGTPKKLPAVTALKKIVSNFSSICFEPEKIMDLRTSIASDYLDWLRIKNKTSAYAPIEKWMKETHAYMVSSALEDRFDIRLDHLEEDFRNLREDRPQRSGRRGWGWFKI